MDCRSSATFVSRRAILSSSGSGSGSSSYSPLSNSGLFIARSSRDESFGETSPCPVHDHRRATALNLTQSGQREADRGDIPALLLEDVAGHDFIHFDGALATGPLTGSVAMFGQGFE